MVPRKLRRSPTPVSLPSPLPPSSPLSESLEDDEDEDDEEPLLLVLSRAPSPPQPSSPRPPRPLAAASSPSTTPTTGLLEGSWSWGQTPTTSAQGGLGDEGAAAMGLLAAAGGGGGGGVAAQAEAPVAGAAGACRGAIVLSRPPRAGPFAATVEAVAGGPRAAETLDEAAFLFEARAAAAAVALAVASPFACAEKSGASEGVPLWRKSLRPHCNLPGVAGTTGASVDGGREGGHLCSLAGGHSSSSSLTPGAFLLLDLGPRPGESGRGGAVRHTRSGYKCG